jgi:hypothetical protein
MSRAFKVLNGENMYFPDIENTYFPDIENTYFPNIENM